MGRVACIVVRQDYERHVLVGVLLLRFGKIDHITKEVGAQGKHAAMHPEKSRFDLDDKVSIVEPEFRIASTSVGPGRHASEQG